MVQLMSMLVMTARFIHKVNNMEDLRFATESEALQHLANITGRKIKVANNEASALLKISKNLIGGEYEIYHKSYTSATEAAYEFAEKKGYKVDDDSWHTEVTTGKGRPHNGDTTKHHIKLLKNDKESRKVLHFQVFDMGAGSYELNMYIS